MRLIKYLSFIKESLEVKHITEDNLEYALQGIRDIDDDINSVDVSFKLIKELEGAQKDSQYIMSFPDHQDKESDLKYEFYDSVVPGTEGYVAYEVSIAYDFIPVDEHSNTFKIGEDMFDVSDEMKAEINRFTKRIRADYKVNLLDWSIDDTSNLSDKIHPVITIYFYKPFKIKITVEDFVKFYNIHGYISQNGKLYMDILFSDLVPVFIRDSNQEENLCRGYSNDDNWDYEVYPSDIEYAINEEHEGKLIKYFADTYFNGSVEDLNGEFGDLEAMLKHYKSEGDDSVDVLYDTYRNLYTNSLQTKHSKELEDEFFRYIDKNYGLSNPILIEKEIEQSIDIKYRVKDDGKIKDKWSKETVYTEKYRFEFDFETLKYYDMEKADGMSLWELWREANDPERVTLEPYYSDYGDVDKAEFNSEISSIFKEQ